MSQITLRVVGDSVIEVGARRVLPTATHFFSFLLYLGIERGRAVTRSELSSLLFPSVRPRDASHSLRQVIYRSKELGVPLRVTASSVLLDRDAVLEDLSAILSSQRLEGELLAPGRLEILPQYSPPTAPLSRWLDEYRDRIRPRLIRLLTRELESYRSSGDWHLVELVAKPLLDLDPYNETGTLGLAEALARIGSKRDAVTLLRRFEVEVGKAAEVLTIPPRVLAKRISDSHTSEPGTPETPLIGRRKDIGRLLSLWTRVRSGRFASVWLSGPESVGKTRLATEFAAAIRIDGTGAVILARCSPLDTHRPLSLFADIAKQLLSMRGAAGCSPDTLSLISRLTTASANSHPPATERRESEYSHIVVRRAVVDLLDSVLSEQALLLVVDDADRLDDASFSLLDEMARCLAARPCFLVLVSRTARSRAIRETLRIRLAPLSSLEASNLAEAVNRSLTAPYSKELLDRSVSLAAGNPGHLRLLLLEKPPSLRTGRVPTTLVAAVDARLSCVSEKALHILQTCAITRSPVATDDIEALTGIRRYALIQSLQELEDHALVELQAAGLQCMSSLIEERARALTPPSVSATLHLRAARRLASKVDHLAPSQEVAWRIAEHWSKAGVVVEALRWQQQCWQQSLAIGQPMAAATNIRAALAVASTAEERAVLLTALAAALRAFGDFTALTEVLQERLALSNHISDSPETRCALAFDVFEAQVYHSTSLRPLVDSLREHIRDPLLDGCRRLRAARLLMRAADHFYDARLARDAFAIVRAIRTKDPTVTLLKLQVLQLYHAVFGDRKQAAASIAGALELTSLVPPSWSRIASLANSTIAHRIACPGPTPFHILERAFDECRAYEVHSTALSVASQLTSAYFDDGYLAKAVEWGKVCTDYASKVPRDQLVIDYYTTQIDLALVSHAFDRARSLLDAFASCSSVEAAPRMMRELLVYKTRIDQISGQGTKEQDLEQLLYFHEVGHALARHDDNIEVIWVALNERKAAAKASNMLGMYLTSSRREVRRCNYWLRLRTATDPVWQYPECKQFLTGLA